MGSRAVQYRPPQYDVDASQQTYLVQKLQPVKDPRTMPKVVGGRTGARRRRASARSSASRRRTARRSAPAGARLARGRGPRQDALVEVVGRDVTSAASASRRRAAGLGLGECLLPFSEAHVEGVQVAPRCHTDEVAPS